MPALMPYVHTDFNVISTWEGENSLIKCHSIPFIEMQGNTNSLTLFAFCYSLVKAFFGCIVNGFWTASHFSAILVLCTWDPPSLCLSVDMYIQTSELFSVAVCEAPSTGACERGGGKGQGAARLPRRNISSSGTRLPWFQVVCTLWRALAPFTVPGLLLQPSISGAGWMKLNKRACVFYQHIW